MDREQEIINRERDIYDWLINELTGDHRVVEDYDLTDHLEIVRTDGAIVSITVKVTLP